MTNQRKATHPSPIRDSGETSPIGQGAGSARRRTFVQWSGDSSRRARSVPVAAAVTRSLLALVAGMAVLSLAPAAASANDVACWYRNLAMVDQVAHPPQRGDNEFFTRSDVPPNLLWIVDNSGSMQTLPCNGDCEDYSRCGGGFNSYGNNFFVDRGYTTYVTDAGAGDAFDPDFCQSAHPRGFNGADGCYKPGLVYRHRETSTSYLCGTWPSGSGSVWVRTGSSDSRSTPEYYCSSRYSNTTSRNNCVTQLKTKGYHPGTNSRMPVFMGAALNIYPPKFVVARKVMKELVLQVKKMRQGLMVFDNGGSNTSTFNGGNLLVEFNPACNMFFPPRDSEFHNNRSKITNAIDDIRFVGGTPMGETLVSACQYFSGNRSRFANEVKVHGTTGVGFSDPDIPNRSGNQDPVCVSCQRNFAVVITDGYPSIDSNVPCKLRNYDRDCKEGLQNSPQCNSVGTSTCPHSERRTYGTVGGADYLDDVAAFCYEEDLRPDLPGKQNAVIHTIGFDVDAPILADAAQQGGGLYLVANDADQLRSALTTVLKNVETRATSFSVASVTTVQTRGSTYAFVPRFRPAADDLWQGHLYRLSLFNEFAAGCTDADTTGEMTPDKLSRNPNGDDTCGDVYLMDKNGNFVGEDDDGRFVLLDTNEEWDPVEGWPVAEPIVEAVPHWDAGERLASRDLVDDPRRIYTVVDLNNDGVLAPNEQIEFTVANAELIAPTLSVGGRLGPICTSMAARKGGDPYATDLDCVRDLIRYVRGKDVFDENRNGSRTDPRPKILGDIFHSAPTLVTPPVPQYLCDLGIVSQCSFPLYGPDLTPGGMEAYEVWAEEQSGRDRFVLVGANDGMLHAFHAGTQREGDDPETGYKEPESHLYHDIGTGEELWAFIPPDLLPRLSELVIRTGEHSLFVDGTSMVRDVWVESDSSGDGYGRKDEDEFHTVAVIGLRQGGRSWTGLDVTNPASPQFLWTWPPPGSPEGLTAGESWNDFSPGAPPIGPVAIADTNGPITVGETAAREVWTVFVGGGFDPNFIRGRSINALNVWTGEPIWRFSATDSTGTGDPRQHLFPVAAPVALLDLGGEASVHGRQDGLFDTAVVGDVMGQMWTVRFHEPGVDLDGDGLMDNWHAGRSFVQFDGQSLANRSPFYQLAEVTIDPTTGTVRAHVGAGDRTNIRDSGGGACGPSNIGACVRKNCSTWVHSPSGNSVDYIGTSQSAGAWRYQPNQSTFSANNVSAPAASLADACDFDFGASHQVSVQCGSVAESYTWGLQCSDGSETVSACDVVERKPEPTYSLINSATTTQNARFYTFAVFGGHSARIPFTTAAEARAYDAAALSDANLTSMSAEGNDTEIAGELGFYIEYPNTDDRTSSPATVLGGCVAWNVLSPGDQTAVCGGNTNDRGNLYRAHFSRGTARCGTIDDDNRYVSRSARVAPPGLTPTVSLNPETGEVRYNLLSVEPGVPPLQTSVGDSELSGGIYWLDVPREVHNCRHADVDCP